MEARLELKRLVWGSNYRNRQKRISLCCDEVERMFDITEREITLVVSSVKPRGSNYYVATWRRDEYYVMTKAESGKWKDWSGWCIAVDRLVHDVLGETKTVYFWMEQ